MPDAVPTTQTMKSSEAHERWADVLDQVSRKQARVLIERRRAPVAAIVSAADLELLARLEAERATQLDAALERMRAAFADVSEEQLEHDVAEVIASVRREERRKKAQTSKT